MSLEQLSSNHITIVIKGHKNSAKKKKKDI